MLGVLAVVCVGGVVVVLRKSRVVDGGGGVGGGRAAVLLLLAIHLRVDRLPGSYLRRDVERSFNKSISDTSGSLRGFVLVGNEETIT